MEIWMYWFWIVILPANPLFLLLEALGFLGEDAKRAADDLATTFGIIFLVLIAVALMYLGLHYVHII